MLNIRQNVGQVLSLYSKSKVMVQNLKDLMAKFSDEAQCRAFLVQQRWNGSPICPYCQSEKWYSIEDGKRFKCGNSKCYKKYSVTVGSVFHASNIPLTTWFPAMYLILSHKKGISSIQLAKDLGVTQKTAWFMLHRIRESLKEKNSPLLSGTLEVDETYSGRKFASEFKGYTEGQIELMKAKNSAKFAKMSKGVVMAIAERGGNIRTKVFSEIDGQTAKQYIKDNVAPGSKVYTDQSSIYRTGLEEYERESVRHTKPNPEFARGDVHVNNVESFWSTFKRGKYGIYHSMSFKHLQAYCNEYAHRANTKQLKDGERFTLQLANLEGRLSYNQLVHGKINKES
jgi:transposase-like protein